MTCSLELRTVMYYTIDRAIWKHNKRWILCEYDKRACTYEKRHVFQNVKIGLIQIQLSFLFKLSEGKY